MATSIERSSLLLSANRALWQEISSAVRVVFVRQDGNTIHIEFVMDGPISDEDYASLRRVGTELASDFPKHEIIDTATRLDAPKSYSRSEEWDVIFARRE